MTRVKALRIDQSKIGKKSFYISLRFNIQFFCFMYV